MLMSLKGVQTWRPETSQNTWSLLWLSQKLFLSAKLENIRIVTSLNILVIQNSKTQGESCFLEAIQMLRIEKKLKFRLPYFQN